jgi:short subunit fatty acids transporter
MSSTQTGARPNPVWLLIVIMLMAVVVTKLTMQPSRRYVEVDAVDDDVIFATKGENFGNENNTEPEVVQTLNESTLASG